jgi:outer membrane immunogenic protein
MEGSMSRLLAVVTALLAGVVSASAADLPAGTPPPPVLAPTFSWTGFYLGGNLGGAWVQNNWTDSVYALDFNSSNGRFIGGGQLGFNYQLGSVVWGVEGEFDWAGNNSGNGAAAVVPAAPVIGGDTLQVISNTKWIATVAARIGFAVDRGSFTARPAGAGLTPAALPSTT